MAKLKQTNKYYFTVEGETEYWYFKWLEKKINDVPESLYKVSFDCKIQKNPIKRVKSLVATNKTTITHIFDFESNEKVHEEQLENTLASMKKAQNLGKQIIYDMGYSSFTFELWIILHKLNFFSQLNHRKQYLKPINKAFSEKFSNLDEYKHEYNFKKILSKLDLDDVKKAIERSKEIKKSNIEKGLTLHNYMGYSYFKENPSLNIWEIIEKIFADCGIFK